MKASVGLPLIKMEFLILWEEGRRADGGVSLSLALALAGFVFIFF